ncbi:MAG: heavy metal translocating P-type ATPase, partial [Thermoplasmatota archaeon]
MSTHEEGTSFDDVLAPVHHFKRLATIGAMALAATASFLALWQRVGLPFDVFGLGATLIGGWPVWMEAWEAIRERQINMEITMALGVAAALVIGQFATAAIIVAFTLFSMYLEDLTKSRGKRALEVLLRAAPDTAHVQRDGQWVEVSAKSVERGELVLVKAGEKVPVDGVVTSGASSVVEAAITGEPFPKEKVKGATVYAGTINGSGALEVEVTRGGEDTTYARIIRLVREATERRGKTQRLADKVAQGIVYVVLAAALITYVVSRNLTTTISVILVAGACGVAAGTPLAILATTAKSARRGVVMKGGAAVEALAGVDTVVFDKTGTLTTGEPAVVRALTFNGTRAQDLLADVAAVEAGSNHPIARAITKNARTSRRADSIHYEAGRGLHGTVAGRVVLVGNTQLLEDANIKLPSEAHEAKDEAEREGHIVVFAAIDGRAAGAILLRDSVRPEAKRAIQRLQSEGLRVVMLTGDHEAPARQVASEVGITDVRAELLPEDKIRIVRDLQAEGRRVCFVGDGINDAPALTEARVGVALQSGSEAAAETADVLLMNNDLAELAESIHAARRS